GCAAACADHQQVGTQASTPRFVPCPRVEAEKEASTRGREHFAFCRGHRASAASGRNSGRNAERSSEGRQLGNNVTDALAGDEAGRRRGAREARKGAKGGPAAPVSL